MLPHYGLYIYLCILFLYIQIDAFNFDRKVVFYLHLTTAASCPYFLLCEKWTASVGNISPAPDSYPDSDDSAQVAPPPHAEGRNMLLTAMWWQTQSALGGYFVIVDSDFYFTGLYQVILAQ